MVYIPSPYSGLIKVGCRRKAGKMLTRKISRLQLNTETTRLMRDRSCKNYSYFFYRELNLQIFHSQGNG